MSMAVDLNNISAVNWLDYWENQGADKNENALNQAPKGMRQEMVWQIKQSALAASLGTKADHVAGISNSSNNPFFASSMERPLAERQENEPRIRRKIEEDQYASTTTAATSSPPKIMAGANDIAPQITGHGVQGGWGAASDTRPNAPLLSPSEFTHQIVEPRTSGRTRKIDLQVCHSAEGRYPLAQVVANITGIPTIGYKGEMRAMPNAQKIYNSKLFEPETGDKAQKTIDAANRQFMKNRMNSNNANIRQTMMSMCWPCRFNDRQNEEGGSSVNDQRESMGRRIAGSTSEDSSGEFSVASSSRQAARVDSLLNAGISEFDSIQRERLRNAFMENMNDRYGRLLIDKTEPAVLDGRIRFNLQGGPLDNHMDVLDAGDHHALISVNFPNDDVGQNASALRSALRQALNISDDIDIVPREDL
ncbi:hypothetical protein [Burkholderia sp. TSV86]|uniref:hypothetical protein n=1 Tax=Burkholderia sp. TSV86 TaxID=1385594 RepID=UPI000AE387E6|nr:hypothetical protein [Burkholderia sp. TSV86]